MKNQIIMTLKKNLENLAEYENVAAEVQRNAIKEILQYYVLDFIYHHSEYSGWIMYGGSALRICHGLNRMSVDLDFEIDRKVDNIFLDKLKSEIAVHFKDAYNIDSAFLTIGTTNDRGLTLKFNLAEDMGLDFHSKQVHVKIDLNHFPIRPKIVTEYWPQNKYQLSFVIKTYNMSALMASKIAAIFLREPRGMGGAIYDYKGRDIYDLLWYMEKKIVPDFDYLVAKKIDIHDLKTLFNKLTVNILNYEKMNALLKEDLSPLFFNRVFAENWLKNWRASYLQLLNDYEINTITTYGGVQILQDFNTDIFSFIYQYHTENKGLIHIVYKLSDYWIKFKDGDIAIPIDNKISDTAQFENAGTNNMPASQQKKLKQYATIFYRKTEDYFKKTNRVILGNTITTKLIRMTADNLNPKEHTLLNIPALLSC